MLTSGSHLCGKMTSAMTLRFPGPAACSFVRVISDESGTVRAAATAINGLGISYHGVFAGTKDPRESLGLACSGIATKQNNWFAGPRSEWDVKVPSDMMAVGDAYYFGGQGYNSSGKFDVYESPGDMVREGLEAGVFFPTKPTGRKRHQGKLNVVFCDGHVEGIKVQALFFSKDDRDLRRWNVDNEPHRERLQFLNLSR